MMGLGLGGFGFIFMILFWVALIALAVWLVGQLFPSVKKSSDPDTSSRSPQEILKARYARGELSKEEYQDMLQDIRE